MTITHRLRTNELYLFWAALLTMLTIVVTGLPLSIDPDLRLSLQVLSIVLAFFSGAFILTRYLARRDLPFLFFGLAYIATAFLDLINRFCVGTVDVRIGTLSPFEVWGWLLSSAFFFVASLVALIVWKHRPGESLPRTVHVALAFVLGIIFIVLDVINLNTLTQMQTTGSLPQLFGLLTGLAILALGVTTTFLHGWSWKEHPIYRSLSYTLLFAAFSDFCFAQSTQIQDPAYALAMIFKLIAFTVPFLGASQETVDLYTQRDAIADKLATQNRELTETKATLLEQSVRLSAVLKQTPVGVMVVKLPGGEATIWNPRAEELLGRSISEETGFANYPGYYGLTKPDGTPYPTEDQLLSGVLKAGKEFRADDIVVERKGKSSLRLSLHAAPIMDGRRVGSAVLVFDDITERKQLEQLKSEFVSIISHQLKSPVTALNWYVEDLTSQPLPPALRASIEDIGMISHHMNDLVSNMLFLSRLETGRLQVVSERVEVTALVKQVVRESMMEAKHKKIKLVLQAGTSPLTTLADPRLLTEVVRNFVDNAIRYASDRGSVHVEVLKEGNGIICRVSDDGIGIPEAEQRAIFRRFFRATNAKKLLPDGNGLGLYIAKSFAELCGGKVGFSSVENHGSTFWLKLKMERPSTKSTNK